MIELLHSLSGELSDTVLYDLIGTARTSIIIASANVRNFRLQIGEQRISISEFLHYFSRKGVQIKLLLNTSAKKSVLISELVDVSGVQIHFCPRNHMKIIAVDDKMVYMGSANLTSAGLGQRANNRRNFECGIVTDQRNLVDEALKVFKSVWSFSSCPECKYVNDSRIDCSYKMK